MPLFFRSGPPTRIAICLLLHPVLLEAGEAIGRSTQSNEMSRLLRTGGVKTFEEAAALAVEDSLQSASVETIPYTTHDSQQGAPLVHVVR